jgi:hypothetical protein
MLTDTDLCFWAARIEARLLPPVEVRAAHGRFFIDIEPGVVRTPRLPYQPEIAYWHWPIGIRGHISCALTWLESKFCDKTGDDV